MKSLLALAPALLSLLAVTPGPVPQKRVEAAPPLYVYNDGGSYFLTLDGGGSSGGGQPVEGIGVINVYNDGGSYAVSYDGGTPLPTTAEAPAFVYNDGGSYSVSVATNAPMTLYVDSSGNDSNACTSTGASACLTIRGALLKVPKIIRHLVTVQVAAGNFQGAVITGFTQDTTLTNASPTGLLIQGTLANSTLTTGSATGTATSGTAGSLSASAYARGTLTDTAATWTTNDLRGRFISITGGTGSGQLFVISENTATTLTISGTWTAPTGTSTYAIQDAATVITTGTTIIPRADGTGSLTPTAFTVANNSFRNLRGLLIKNFRSTLTNAFAVSAMGGSMPSVEQFQNFQTGTFQPFRMGGEGYYSLLKVYSKLPAQTVGNQNGIHVGNDLISGNHLSVVNSVFENGQYAMSCSGSVDCAYTQSDFWTIDRGLEFQGGANGTASFSVLNCAGGQGQWGVVVGDRHDGATQGASVSLGGVVFRNCWYGIEQGGGNLYITGASGLTGGPVLNLRGGGKVTASGAGITNLRGSDGGSNDFFMDAYGAAQIVTGRWSDFDGYGDGGTYGSCIGTLAGASSMCLQP